MKKNFCFFLFVTAGFAVADDVVVLQTRVVKDAVNASASPFVAAASADAVARLPGVGSNESSADVIVGTLTHTAPEAPTATPAANLVHDSQVPVAEVHKFSAYATETKKAAVSRWLWSLGIKSIAFDPRITALNDAVSFENAKGFGSDIQRAVRQLLNEPTVFVSLDIGQPHVAAIHKYTKPKVHITQGKTLQDAVAALVIDYGWVWNTESNWLVKDNFSHPHERIFVTEDADISSALTELLDGYPVRAQQMHATKTIYIIEDSASNE